MRKNTGVMAQFRRNAGLTQKQMADALGIHTTVYARYEQGQRVPNARMLFRIADVLGITDLCELRSLVQTEAPKPQHNEDSDVSPQPYDRGSCPPESPLKERIPPQ